MTDVIYNEMSNVVKCDYKEFLYQKYVVEMLPTSKIALQIGKGKTTIITHLKDLGIELRHGSSAIKTQWLNNDSRKEKQASFAKYKLTQKEVREKIHITQQTKEYRQKQSLSKQGSKNGMFGKIRELSPQWNPNLSDDERIKGRKTFDDVQWRNDVFKRDNYTCKKCGDNKGHNLNAHHIINHCKDKSLRYDVNNGITLCDKCHIAFHKQYGYKDNNEIQLKEFLNK